MSKLYKDENRLENNEVRKYFIGKGYDQELVDKVLEQFWFRDLYISLLTYRSYFELLEKFFQKKGIEAFTRPDFYKFVFEELVGPSKGSNYKKVQSLALAFERMHTDRLEVGDFNELLTKLKISSDLIVELSKTTPLFQFSKIKEEGDKEFFIWGHHTLSEYPAAEYILGQHDPVKVAEKLMVFREADFVAFKNSWYGTLRFLLESDKAQLFTKWLADFGNKYPENIDDDFSQIFLFVDPTKLDDSLKSEAFELIYNHYKKKILWLPVFSRRFIGRFFQKKHFSLLKEDIKKQETETKTFVYRGNAVAVIDSLFENESSLLTGAEKSFWKDKLVTFANDENENGVLQRHSLSALENYQDPKLIPLVKKAFKHKDSLVREAFIQFCYKTAPNDPLTIDYLVEAITSGMVIYGRFGLYEIDSKEGLSYLLDKFTDQNFLRIFIDRESIFDEEKDRGDHTLIENITKVFDNDILRKLETLLLVAFSDSEAYHLEDSKFIKKIALLVSGNDSDFVFELLKQTKEIPDDQKRQHTFYIVERILPYLIGKENLQRFFKELADYPVTGAAKVAEYAVYAARRELGKKGLEIYEFAVKKNLVVKVEDIPPLPESHFRNTPKSEYEEFQRLLEPEPGKYLPGVFEYFYHAYNSLKNLITKEEKTKLIKVTKSVLSFDTSKIRLTLTDKSNNSQFTWTDVASYFGDALRVLKMLSPEDVNEFREHIINFIPFAFSEDQATLAEVLRDVSDDELGFVYSAYSNEESDLRYFLPSSFIYVISQFKKSGSKIEKAGDIFLSLALDNVVGTYDRTSAFKNYSLFINSKDTKAKKVLDKVFLKISSEDQTEKKLAEIANSLLIEIFRDKKSINWRFSELRKRAFQFEREVSFEAHSVGPQEEELNSLSFAKPLIDLKSSGYQKDFLRLLDNSLEILRQGDDRYWSYVNYLWRIVTAYFDNLRALGSIEPFLNLQKWAVKNSKGDKSNWFQPRLAELRVKYVDSLGIKTLKDL